MEAKAFIVGRKGTAWRGEARLSIDTVRRGGVSTTDELYILFLWISVNYELSLYRRRDYGR